ncbi:DNA-directed RNA polymerases I and III subunit RPAC2 [Nematocida major]|uniref:DNA-directed RNA polymerases I and III subunit RPAC2 n=1 Tax=Nematocida major TaxID=1912982 RepID=UPI0020085FE6|nr:DNA-directed RNA polymerases I and III subunit RPAC2 [Nematocida major]KAH9386821.1 DNA-directed RNA polymerases I and III subunit RPAC2 [Nematocida major]
MEVHAKDEYTIEVLKTNHTVLNLVRWAIGQFESVHEVDLVGYTIPHPMEERALMKIQLKKEESQTREAIMDVFRRGVAATQSVIDKIQAEMLK